MKFSLPTLLFGFCISCVSLSQAQDAPYSTRLLSNLNLDRGGATTTVDLGNLFALENVAGPLFEFALNVGYVYVELYPDVAPITVANFRYYSASQSYDGTFLHRSVPGFVVQGGGYYFATDFPHVLTNPPILNEAALPNVHGTISMARSSELNSATSEWFFNTADNSLPGRLDAPYAVFGRLIGGGVAFVDLINTLNTTNINAPSDPNGPFTDVPYFTTSTGDANALTVEALREAPLLRLSATSPGYLTVTATTTDGNIVSPEITAAGLQLTSGNTVGSARIVVTATDPLGQYASVAFTATTVQPGLPVVSIRALDSVATESGNPGRIRLTRTGPTQRPLVIHLDVSASTTRYGADFPAFGASTIPAGKKFLDLVVRPKNDAIKEGLEVLNLAVVNWPNYSVAPERLASVTIIDNDVPNVTASVVSGATAEKVGDVAVVKFTRTGVLKRALSVPFELSGTARPDQDYTATASPAVIPAGQKSVTVSFTAIADTVKEATETIVVTPTASKAYNIQTNSVTVSVIDHL